MPAPKSIQFSSALLLGAGGLVLLRAVFELIFVNTDLSGYKDAYTGHTGSGLASIIGAVGAIFGATVVWLLAVLNSSGRQAARITTFVLGWLFLVCGGFGSLAGAFHRPARSAGSGLAAQVTPIAYGTISGGLELMAMVAALAAMALLALPAASAFFENRRLTAYAKALGYPPITPPAGYRMPEPPTTPPSGYQMPEQAPHTSGIPAIDPWAQN